MQIHIILMRVVSAQVAYHANHAIIPCERSLLQFRYLTSVSIGVLMNQAWRAMTVLRRASQTPFTDRACLFRVQPVVASDPRLIFPSWAGLHPIYSDFRRTFE
jgi:hypothetical protein